MIRSKTLAKHRALKIVSKRLSLSAKALNINLVEMIKTIRIQNFRSLQDVTLGLQDVNLLIGPNNSGKTNLMKSLRFLGEFLNRKIGRNIDSLKSYFYLQKLNTEGEFLTNPPIAFTVLDKVYVYKIEIFGFDGNEFIVRQFFGTLSDETNTSKALELNLNDINSLEEIFLKFVLQNNGTWKQHYEWPFIPELDKKINDFHFRMAYFSDEKEHYKFENAIPYTGFIENSGQFIHSKSLRELNKVFSKIDIYSINLSSLKQPYPTLEDDYSVASNASNLVAFLDNMKDNKPLVINTIIKHLKECIKEFEYIISKKVKLSENDSLVKIHGNRTFKQFGLQDKYGHDYMADELSDGTLYFLALLAIIHQPDPPKLLMIEEPENGIHPRRIKEIIDYFFNIAEEKGIQVILTTHSTVVIDQFKDMPESIFVFDKKDQATQVKNLATDIIAEDIELSKKNNVPPLDLSGSLGDHWAAGLIGGVPR